MTVDSKSITQLAIVVKDIDKTLDHYVKVFGIERPKVDYVPANSEIPTFLHGKPQNMSDVKIAVIQMGDVVLELTEPGQSDSPWKRFLDKHGEGVHHVGILVEDLDNAHRSFAEIGADVEHVGFYPNLTYSFVDAADLMGVNFNIKTNTDNADIIAKAQANPAASLNEL